MFLLLKTKWILLLNMIDSPHCFPRFYSSTTKFGMKNKSVSLSIHFFFKVTKTYFHYHNERKSRYVLLHIR